MQSSLAELFAKTKLDLSRRRYVIATLEKKSIPKDIFSRLTPFSSVTVDGNGVSIVLEEKLWKRYASYQKGAKVAEPYRLITFDIDIDLNVCGYFAAISKLMADSGISIFPISTYSRDHILVHQTDHRRAVAILTSFIGRQKQKKPTGA
jgi:hypothetical protein